MKYDAMEISYTNTRAHTLHMDIVHPSQVAEHLSVRQHILQYRPISAEKEGLSHRPRPISYSIGLSHIA